MNDAVILKNVKSKNVATFYTVEMITRLGHRFTYFSSVRFDEASEIFKRIVKELRETVDYCDKLYVMIAKNEINTTNTSWEKMIEASYREKWAIELSQRAFRDKVVPDDEDDE